MRLPALRAAILFAIAALPACGAERSAVPGSPPPEKAAPEQITVLAAASLSDALAEIQALYKSSAGGETAISYGASGTLAGQVKNGAPADVVVFAGAGPMDGLEREGLIDRGSRFNLLTNRLVVVGAAGSGNRPGTLQEMVDEYSGRIAIGDTASVPAGQYARAALETTGLWERVQTRLIPQLDVRAVAAAVSSGNAEFGFVYATDAATVRGVEVVLEVPPDTYPEVVYPAAVVSGSKNRDSASSFLEFMRSQEARAVIEEYGFTSAK